MIAGLNDPILNQRLYERDNHAKYQCQAESQEPPERTEVSRFPPGQEHDASDGTDNQRRQIYHEHGDENMNQEAVIHNLEGVGAEEWFNGCQDPASRRSAYSGCWSMNEAA